MKKIILSAAILFALAGTTQAQISAGNLFNKAKDKAKQKAEEKNKPRTDKNNQTENTSNTETMKDEKEAEQTTDYSGMNTEKYIQALGEKSYAFNQINMFLNDSEEGINQYHNHAASLDLPNFYPVMQKKGKPSDDGESAYTNIMEQRSAYPAMYTKNIKPYVSSKIEKAYQLKKFNKLEAVALLKMAAHLNDACLLVMPDMKNAQEAKAELDKALTDIGGAQAKVLTSDVHKKNAGKILFSKQPIVPGKENPAQFTTNFAAGDRIYAIAYLPGTIQELTNVRDNQKAPGQYRLKVDGEDVNGVYALDFSHNDADKKNAYFLIEVRPDPAKAMHGLDANYFAERFADLSPRKHTIGLKFSSPTNYSEAFAYGEIQLDWTNGDADKMMADAKGAVNKAQDNFSKTVQLDPAFSKPNYTFKDPSLSVANLKKVIMESKPEIVQILKMVTVKEANATEDWNIQKNEYGTPLQKYTNHYTSIAYKAKDGNCYMLYVIQFLKVAQGGGRYGNLMMGATGIKERIACENIK